MTTFLGLKNKTFPKGAFFFETLRIYISTLYSNSLFEFPLSNMLLSKILFTVLILNLIFLKKLINQSTESV